MTVLEKSADKIMIEDLKGQKVSFTGCWWNGLALQVIFGVGLFD